MIAIPDPQAHQIPVYFQCAIYNYMSGGVTINYTIDWSNAILNNIMVIISKLNFYLENSCAIRDVTMENSYTILDVTGVGMLYVAYS